MVSQYSLFFEIFRRLSNFLDHLYETNASKNESDRVFMFINLVSYLMAIILPYLLLDGEKELEKVEQNPYIGRTCDRPNNSCTIACSLCIITAASICLYVFFNFFEVLSHFFNCRRGGCFSHQDGQVGLLQFSSVSLSRSNYLFAISFIFRSSRNLPI